MVLMDEQTRMQQFYLRTLLAIGLLWGAFLLVQLLVFLLTPDAQGSPLASASLVVNCLSVFPAFVLGFWHRRAACVWLVLNAILIAATTTLFTLQTHRYDWGLILGALFSIALAICLVVMEARRWPGALAQRHSATLRNR